MAGITLQLIDTLTPKIFTKLAFSSSPGLLQLWFFFYIMASLRPGAPQGLGALRLSLVSLLGNLPLLVPELSPKQWVYSPNSSPVWAGILAMQKKNILNVCVKVTKDLILLDSWKYLKAGLERWEVWLPKTTLHWLPLDISYRGTDVLPTTTFTVLLGCY